METKHLNLCHQLSFNNVSCTLKSTHTETSLTSTISLDLEVGEEGRGAGEGAYWNRMREKAVNVNKSTLKKEIVSCIL